MDFPVTSGTGLDREARSVFIGLDSLIPDVVYMLPRCDEEITIRKTLSEVAQQFCRDTGVFEYTTANVVMVTDSKRYAIAIPWQADIKTVKEVRLYSVDPVTLEETLIRKVAPEAYWIEDPIEDDHSYLNFYTAINPSAAGALVLKIDVSLIPYIDDMLGTQATALPDKFIRRWRAAFVSGTVAELAGMDNKGWTNKFLAESHGKRFRTLKEEACDKAQLSHGKRGGQTCRNGLSWP